MTLLKNTWHHIRRSPFQSLTAITIMVICFFAINSFAIISNGLSVVLKYFETKPEVTIFLKDNVDPNTLTDFQKDLASYPNVKEVKYISKEQALNLYKEQNKDNPMLTEMVTASILPASLEITVSDAKVLDQIYKNYSTKTTVVDEIIYQKDIVKSLLDWTNVIRKTGIVIIAIVAIISFFTIFIVVGMKITNRKEEIRISRLLGASTFYVKRPFLLEGIFYGIAGSLIGSSISLVLALTQQSRINSFFQPVIFISNDIAMYVVIIAAEILLGMVLGLIASWIGARRYIKF
jgi:cell division transport system permease protein